MRPPPPLLGGFALLLALVAGVWLSGALEGAEARALDLAMQARLAAAPAPAGSDPGACQPPEATVPADDAVVVVGLDDASLAEAQVPLALLHRQLGAFFEAMAAARPRGVAVDLVLPRTSYDRLVPGLDAALARGILALRPVAPLVLGLSAGADGRVQPLAPLFASLAGPEGTALVFVPRDPDGVMRRYHERIGEDGSALPTLAGQLARRMGVPMREGLVPYFRGPRFDPVPLSQVLGWQRDGRQDCLRARFQGRVVLLGSRLAFDDLHRVPVPLALGDQGGTSHGVFIHAAQLRALLGAGPVQALPGWLGLAVALLLACAWWLPPGSRTWALGLAATAGVALASPLALGAGVALPAAGWIAAVVAGVLGRTALSAWQSASERRRLRQAFDGTVSPAVLEQILAGRLDPRMAGERRDVCVLFSDIRGFTTLSEGLSPEAVTDLLNRYFDRMTGAIHRHGGTLDKFIGDGIMAFFGAPLGGEDACEAAFGAARDMVAELEAFNAEQGARGAAPIAIGIGLHHGPALIGYIGARARYEYTAIGDTVNTASRLEGLTKDVGHPVVVSPSVRARLAEPGCLTDLGEHALKGRAPVHLHGWKPG